MLTQRSRRTSHSQLTATAGTMKNQRILCCGLGHLGSPTKNRRSIMWRPKLMSIPSAAEALPGREQPLFSVAETHYVSGNLITGPCPDGLAELMLGMGCFWGAERKFWSLPGVYSTAVGYGAGHTPNPTYEEVCSGLTGHNELV